MPEMSVVRFHESDVIVASWTAGFYNYANTGTGASYDGKVIINGTTYSHYVNPGQYDADLFTPYGIPSNPDIQVTGTEQGKYLPFNNIISNDAQGLSSGVVDGIYVWNPNAGSNGVFEIRQ